LGRNNEGRIKWVKEEEEGEEREEMESVSYGLDIQADTNIRALQTKCLIFGLAFKHDTVDFNQWFF
jgi:hypothetical protein